MASAKRLIDVRQLWFSSNSTAEIRVPAWPMPIHQTKFTIANPQPIGIRMPQIPTPLTNKYVTATFSSIRRAKEMAKPNIQPLLVPLPSTIELILSVTVASVWPGSRIGAWPASMFCEPSGSTK